MRDQVAVPQRRSTSANNRVTAGVLLSIALVFFAGVIAKYWWLNGG